MFHVEVPIKTVSELNRREHWAARARRVKAQRAATLLALRCSRHDPLDDELANSVGCKVLLVRVGPRKLDDDNLRGALKAVRDAVAEWLGKDDGSDWYRWHYGQDKGKYGVRIYIGQV